MIGGINNDVSSVLNSGVDTSIMNDKDYNLHEVNQYIEGHNWTVDYYSSLLASGDTQTPFDRNAIPAVAQFEKISNLILKVVTPIDPTHHGDTNGEANVIGGIIPRVGDFFTARISGWRKAIFRIDEVVRRHYNLNRIYSIIYKLDVFIEDTQAFRASIESKVVRHFVYTDHAIVTIENATTKNTLVKTARALEKMYINSFFSKDVGSLSVPSDDIVLDLANTEFVMKVFDRSRIKSVSYLNRVDDNALDNTIYSKLIERDCSRLSDVNETMLVELVASNVAIPVLKTIGYLDAKYLVVHGGRTDTEADFVLVDYVPVDELPDRSKYKKWLFSDNFYTSTAPLTKIETLVMSYLRGNDIDSSALIDIADLAFDWSPIDRYYYVPVLVLLLKNQINVNRSQYA